GDAQRDAAVSLPLRRSARPGPGAEDQELRRRVARRARDGQDEQGAPPGAAEDQTPAALRTADVHARAAGLPVAHLLVRGLLRPRPKRYAARATMVRAASCARCVDGKFRARAAFYTGDDPRRSEARRDLHSSRRVESALHAQVLAPARGARAGGRA